jgi:hypothetical protein
LKSRWYREALVSRRAYDREGPVPSLDRFTLPSADQAAVVVEVVDDGLERALSAR